jgi:hypothetical protein
MQRYHCLLLMLTVLVAIVYSTGSSADERCCAQCGCAQCQKICRLVCEDKKVTITCYGCKSEDFCVPCPSKPGCLQCEEDCGNCEADGKDVCARPKKFLWLEWQPGLAKIYTRQKLMRKVVTKKIPSYKWVVEDLCAECQAKCAIAEVTPDADIPAAPKLAGVKVVKPSRGTVIPASHAE